MNKILAGLASVFLLTTSLSSFAGYAEKDGGVRHEIIKQVIVPILVTHKICRDYRDCESNDVIQASAKVGIEFYIYGVSERQIINELFIAITQFSSKYPTNLQLSVDVFLHSQAEKSVWERPIATLFIKGEK